MRFSPTCVIFLVDVLLIADAAGTGLASCPCLPGTSKSVGGIWSDGFSFSYLIRLGSGVSQLVPDNYGLGECRAWDVNGSLCSEDSLEFCSQHWCYVDFSKCLSSPVTFQASSFNEGFYYSYETCGGNGDAWMYREWENVSYISGQTLRAAVPMSTYAKHYRLDKSGNPIFGYHENIEHGVGEYLGYDIEYFNLVAKTLNISFQFQRVSEGCAKKYASKWTACACDVQRGLIDLCASVMWSTAERATIAHFTSDIAVQNFRVMILAKGNSDTSFLTQLSKVFKPFTGLCWLLIVCIVGVVGVLLVALSGGLYPKGERCTCSGMLIKIVRSMRDAEIAFLSQSAGGSALDDNDLKILRLGFSWFILTIFAAYTANLTTFLMSETRVYPVRRMEDCQRIGCRLCVIHAVGSHVPETVRSIYGHGIEYVVSEPYATNEAGVDWAAEQLRQKTCDAAIVPETFNEIGGVSDWDDCSVALTGPVVVFYFLAAAVNPTYSKAFDYAIRSIGPSGRNQYYDTVMRKYIQKSKCTNKLSVEATELKSLNIQDLTGSFVPLAITAVLAFVYHTVAHFRNERRANNSAMKQTEQMKVADDRVEIKVHDGDSTDIIKNLRELLQEFQEPRKLGNLREASTARSEASNWELEELHSLVRNSTQVTQEMSQRFLLEQEDTQTRLKQLEQQVGALRTLMCAKRPDLLHSAMSMVEIETQVESHRAAKVLTAKLAETPKPIPAETPKLDELEAETTTPSSGRWPLRRKKNSFNHDQSPPTSDVENLAF